MVAGRFKVGIEIGQVDNAEFANGVFVLFEFFDLALGRLLFQFDLVAHNINRLRARARTVGSGNHHEDHLGVDLATDKAYGFIERPVENAYRLLVFFSDRNNLVALLKASVAFGRAAGNELGDFGHAVFCAQHGTDADERERHVDIKIFNAAGRHVVAVRVINLGEGGEIALEQHLIIKRVHGHFKLLIPFADELFRREILFIVQICRIDFDGLNGIGGGFCNLLFVVDLL